MARLPSTEKEIKILVVQMRKLRDMLGIERKNFLQFTRLADHQLVTLDLYGRPDFDPNIILGYDGFFVGGLSDDSASSEVIDNTSFPFLEAFAEMLKVAENNDIPGLLSCGGFMLGCHVFGGKVIIDPLQKELGAYDIFLTKAGSADKLLHHLPKPFTMISGHNKSLESLPPGCILLASSARCRVHIIKRKASRLYAFQGHPEVTCGGLRLRLEPYVHKYFNDMDAYDRVITLNKDTSLANGLLQRFIDVVVMNKEESL